MGRQGLTLLEGREYLAGDGRDRPALRQSMDWKGECKHETQDLAEGLE